MNELALFAGAGGGILGGKLLGWRTVCAVEINAHCASVLMARQNDGCLPPCPIWDDVCTFDGYPWRGIVDVVSGGFPCQDISSAGRGAGINGKRSGLWGEMARIVREVRPQYVLVENSPLLTLRGIDRVLGDLAAMGYDAKWGVLGAVDAGAPHQRDRIWIVAHADGIERRAGADREDGTEVDYGCPELVDVSNPDGQCCQEQRKSGTSQAQYAAVGCNRWWRSESGLVRVAHGVAHRVDRIKALGNGQVPAVARLAWEKLSNAP